ncbi:MAG: VacJ family lipoprotein [Mariprofundaceae bacterium]|nr:VacJ family lipoprotein [Mariprofundaceae bacterium]
MSRYLVVILLLGLLPSCATVQNDYDPLVGLNRGTASFNTTVDKISLKPIAKGYQAVTSKNVRNMVSNFYDNTTYLNTILNDFLQGKGQQGFEDFARFIINSTVGVAGLADPASSLGLGKHDEDFGQTLAVWGVDQGAYIVYPFLGPNSVRNTPGFITETATDPLFWVAFVVAPQVTIPITVLKYIDKRSRLMDASDMRDELALDPYVFTREAWRQSREYKIYDGNPPASASEDDWGDDPFDGEPSFNDSKAADPVGGQPSTTTTPTPQYKPHIRLN